MGQRWSRSGHAVVVSVFELLMLTLGCGLMMISTQFIVKHQSETSNFRRPVVPIVAVWATCDNGQLLMRRGPREIVSLDLKTRRIKSIYHQAHQPILSATVTEDARSQLIVFEGSELVFIRNGDFTVLEPSSNTPTMESVLSPDGRIAILICDRTSAQCWDLSNEDPIEFRFPLDEPVARLGLNWSGDTLAASTDSGDLRLYDVKTGVRLRTLSGDRPISADPIFSHDGKWLVIGRDQSIELYDIRLNKVMWTLATPQSQNIRYLAMSSDGDWIAASGVEFGIQIIDRSTGTPRFQFSPDSGLDRIAFAPTNDRLYSGGAAGSIRVWSLVTGHEIEQFELNSQLE